MLEKIAALFRHILRWMDVPGMSVVVQDDSVVIEYKVFGFEDTLLTVTPFWAVKVSEQIPSRQAMIICTHHAPENHRIGGPKPVILDDGSRNTYDLVRYTRLVVGQWLVDRDMTGYHDRIPEELRDMDWHHPASIDVVVKPKDCEPEIVVRPEDCDRVAEPEIVVTPEDIERQAMIDFENLDDSIVGRAARGL